MTPTDDEPGTPAVLWIVSGTAPLGPPLAPPPPDDTAEATSPGAATPGRASTRAATATPRMSHTSRPAPPALPRPALHHLSLGRGEGEETTSWQ